MPRLEPEPGTCHGNEELYPGGLQVDMTSMESSLVWALTERSLGVSGVPEGWPGEMPVPYGSPGLQLYRRALKRELSSWQRGVWQGPLEAESRGLLTSQVQEGEGCWRGARSWRR